MKTITIRDDIHRDLKSLKRDGESFSEVIKRLLDRKNTDMSTYFGALRDSPVMEELLEVSAKTRAAARSRT